ncbi:MAG: alanine--tRNA ligase [Anaerolineales bacterium]
MSRKRQTTPSIKWQGSAVLRQSFLDFFEERGHTIVPSMSLVPGGDQTLLFTNSGMVQFKDVFLGIGSRPYTRVADAQKCMRVAGKHNDLDDVGRDDTHHTFFEMLGNWSFGDYYKAEAIPWAWELLTEVWGLPRDRLWATCFEDEQGQVPRDDEAADIWLQQPGFQSEHLLFFGRKDNFWEMADTGPCGPDSEIHLDRGPEYCDKANVEGHVCRVNGDCQRFLELWNLVFIQYNRSSPTDLKPLPARHVDTGMGFDRLVSVIQNVDSNYLTDLFQPMIQKVRQLAGHDENQVEEYFTPYRVIADHSRAASFLIADGVVPGNVGRNYVSRMIIRRASRFGSMIGLNEPFLAQIAETVIETYGGAYPELEKNRKAILETLTEEEDRFHRTIDTGIARLNDLMQEVVQSGQSILPGDRAFDLYSSSGLPLEITRDIAREHDLQVDEDGFHEAMEKHRIASGGGDAMGELVEHDVETYRDLLKTLQEAGKLPTGGVEYDPYDEWTREGEVLALLKDGKITDSAGPGEEIGLVLRSTPFYVEAGGQVSDTGLIQSTGGEDWQVEVNDTRQPVTGLIVHFGRVRSGHPELGSLARASINADRRLDIMRNHTATHLLHAALRRVLGEHVRQAGSLVAPDRLRFDFTHSHAMTDDELARVEKWVNEAILANYPLSIVEKPRDKAVSEGAMALFGETYGEIVRTVSIGQDNRISYELCGGTHVEETGIIASFLILSESSVAAGIRRIEAVTGREAYALIHARLANLDHVADQLGVGPAAVENRIEQLLEERSRLLSEISNFKKNAALATYEGLEPHEVAGSAVLTGVVPGSNPETLRELADRFRSAHPSSVVVLGTIVDEKPLLIAALSDDLISHGLHAGKLVQHIAKAIDGGGGGKPGLAQAGGKLPDRLPDALAQVDGYLREHLK